MNQETTVAGMVGNHADQEYDGHLSKMQKRFLANTDGGKKPLFTTDVENLWIIYLDGFADPADRQYHNCHACRHFIERFGGLVTIDEDGTTAPAIWDEEDAPEAYKPAVAAMARAVRRSKVTGVFLSSENEWGKPTTGVWRHFAVAPTKNMVLVRLTQTAGQAMAEKEQDFIAVSRALGEFSPTHLETAVTLLQAEALYRSEKVLGQAKWLRDLQLARSRAHGDRKANTVWLAVATAPSGFCHPRSSMIGTLLEDIAAGKAYEEVKRAFDAKMHPLQYQRPQAAPTAGAIAAAEEIVAKLGAAGSLERRFCRLDEIKALWRPKPKQEPANGQGVFGHLKPKGEADASVIVMPTQTMTWDKFQKTVLPTAERIEFLAPTHGQYSAFVTAVNHDAPPILQWDTPENRNPVSWYFWAVGSSATQFGLRGNTFVDVDAITLKPSMWNGGFEHHGSGVMFVLSGARESWNDSAGLFPEILKAEFHGVRSVIEAYSRSCKKEGMNEPHVAGIMLSKGNDWSARLRVWTGGRAMDYRLDRWD